MNAGAKLSPSGKATLLGAFLPPQHRGSSEPSDLAGCRTTWRLPVRSLLSGSVLLSLACSSATPSAEAPAPTETDASTPSTEDTTGAVETASRTEDKGAPGDEGPTPSETAAPPSGQQLCENLCEKVAASCKQDLVKFCLASCPDYEEASQRCPLEVEEALTCQMKSETFLLCSSVASEVCAPYYQAMSDCREGRREPKAEKTKAVKGPPDGWQWVNLPTLGGTYLFPNGKVRKDGDSQVVQRDDVSFRIQPLASVPDKYDDKSILRLATAFVGTTCEKKLRLHGRYETGDVIHVRFTTSCETSTGLSPWSGIFHLFPGRGVVASVRPTQGTTPVPQDADTFFFGFELP